MNRQVLAYIFIVLTACQVAAADLGTPQLSDSVVGRKFFDPDRLITSAGIKYSGAGNVSLEPQLGLGYTTRDQEQGRGIDQSIHKVHAQAGGKFDLGGTFFFSAAAKVPVYTYETADRRVGVSSSQDVTSHHAYDFTRIPRANNLTWTSEIGIRLGRLTELSIYYDQTQFDSFQPGMFKPEERFGTKFIFKFK